MSTKIGFSFENNIPEREIAVPQAPQESVLRKSVVEIRFPDVYRAYSYYNDKFDLKIGDKVFVDGKLEGVMGVVTDVSYDFKIKLSDYKRVIRKVETDIKGEFEIIGKYLMTFSPSALPYEKALTWFKAPENEEDTVCGYSDEETALDDIAITRREGERGDYLFSEDMVEYFCLCGNKGRAIVRDEEIYEVEFTFKNGKISRFTCDCYYAGMCSHKYAAILKLRETLDLIEKKYGKEYEKTGCVAVVKRDTLLSVADTDRLSGKFIFNM